MNKNFLHQWQSLWEWLDRYKIFILLGNLFLWPYYFLKLLGVVLVLLLLLILWAIGKGIVLWQERPLKPKFPSDGPAPMSLNFTPQPMPGPKADPLWQSVIRICNLKVGYALLTYACLTLFFISVFLYNGALVGEGFVKTIALISAVTYLGLHALNWQQDPEISETLKRILDHLFPSWLRSLFLSYSSHLNILNIYLFPFIALLALACGIGFLWGAVSSGQLENILLLYLISTGLMVVNHYTTGERGGFLLIALKKGGLIKTLLYFFIPGYLIWQLLVHKDTAASPPMIMVGLFIGIGSVILAYKDRLYWHSGLPIIARSGKELTSSYFKTLFKIGLMGLVLYGAYLGTAYISKSLEKTSPFADVETSHWAYPALLHLYEKGVVSPDSDQFIHPARWLNQEEGIGILFQYFGLEADDYSNEPEVSFVKIQKTDPLYPLFKAAHFLRLIDENHDPLVWMNKKEALTMISLLNDWPSGEPMSYAQQIHIIDNSDEEDLKQPLTRSVMAQMLYRFSMISSK